MKYYYGKINTSMFIQYDMNIIDIEGTPSLQNKIVSVPPLYDAPVTNATQVSTDIIGVDGTTSIPTGFSPDLDTYQIEETVRGELQDFADNKFTNSTFDANIDGWDEAFSSSVSSWSSLYGGCMLIESTFISHYMATTDGGGIEDGEVYSVSLRLYSESGFDRIACYSGSGYVDILNTALEGGQWHDVNFIITITADYTKFIIRAYTKVSGDDTYVDDIYAYLLTTKTQRTETRVLQHHPVYGDRYYIDGVRQDFATLPDPAVDMNLNNIAKIGYPDLVDQRIANFNVFSEIDTTAPKPLVLPSTPEDLTVEYDTDTRVLISWTYPVAGTYPISDTIVIVDGVENSSRNGDSLIKDATPNIAIDYSVYAVDTRGNVSPTSDIVTYTNVVEPAHNYLLDGRFSMSSGTANFAFTEDGYTLEMLTVSTNFTVPSIRFNNPDILTEGNIYTISLVNTINSGTVIFSLYINGAYVENQVTLVGGELFEYTFTLDDVAVQPFIAYDGRNIFDISVVGSIYDVTP